MNSNAVCYKGDGTVSDNIPCAFPSISQCCGKGWDCLTNGLCRQHGTTAYSQGTCTDPSFINCLSICNQERYEGFTEVSRCEQNGNSWCCAGTAGQGLGGVDCCATNSTTSLEPYPLSTIDGSGKSGTASTSLLSTASLKSTSSSSSSFSSSSLSSSSTSSPAPTILPSSVTLPTSSISPQPASQSHNSMTGIKIGVPLAIIIVLLACLAFFFFWKHRIQKQDLVGLKRKGEEDPLSPRPELLELEENPVCELDVPHHELPHPNAPRHELS